MSCDDGVCGTGGWTGPLPGDPDNNVLLSATAELGGIQLSWTYPGTYPWAVAHTQLYRGASLEFDQALLLVPAAAGSSYFDRIDSPAVVTYYYWIVLVSVNGTYGAPVGPAMATAIPLGAATAAILEGVIGVDAFDQDLKNSITDITTQGLNLAQEVIDRIASNATLMATLAEVQSDTGEAMTLLQNEVTQRISADSAMVGSINVLAAGMGDNAAAIVTEQNARATADGALSTRINTLVSTTTTDKNTLTAAITAEATARTTADTANATSISQVSTRVGTAESLIQTETTTRASQTGSLFAKYGVTLSAGGKVAGFRINNDSVAGSDFIILTDKFAVATESNGTTKYPFTIGTIGGVSSIGINANMYIDGSISAQKINANGLSIRDTAGNLLLNAGSSAATSTFLGNVTGTVGGMTAANVATFAGYGNTALAAINDATGGLGTKLKANAQNVLAGPGGFSTGSLTWNSSGQRTGGYGVGFSAGGLAAFNSAGQATFALDAATGAATFSGIITGSMFNTGNFTTFGWPASGGGSHLSGSGLLLGNFNTGQYMQLNQDGSFSMPGMSGAGGVLTVSQLNVIGTGQIKGGAVSGMNSVNGTAQTISTTLSIPTNETMSVVIIASAGTTSVGATANTVQANTLIGTIDGTNSATLIMTGVEVNNTENSSNYYMPGGVVVSRLEVSGGGSGRVITCSATDSRNALKTLVVFGTLR